VVRRWRMYAGLAALVLLVPVVLSNLLSRQTPPAEASPNVPRLRVEVVARYPHDTGAFTEGLELHDGRLYEGTGRTGQSDLRVVEPKTGGVRARAALPEPVFGEGITVVGRRIWQLTFQNEFAFLRDRDTLAEIRRVPYQGEGWGLCHDAARHRLVMSDGGARLTFRDPETFRPLGSVPVTVDGRSMRGINELECVGDKVWANVWRTDRIVRIDAVSGRVEAVADAAEVRSRSDADDADVLNGIASVPGTGTFLITGKLWRWTFLVRFTER
jgi:glutamine cyclotransferase